MQGPLGGVGNNPTNELHANVHKLAVFPTYKRILRRLAVDIVTNANKP